MNHLAITPILLPLVSGTLLLLVRGVLPLAIRRWLNLLATAALTPLAIWLLLRVGSGEILTYQLGDWPAPVGIILVADRLAAWMLLVTALLALVALGAALRGTDRGSRHFHPLFQLQLFGLNGAFLTGDLFNLFVFFEVLLLASYGLLVHGGGAARIRAGLQFVVLNLAGSTLFLFAAGTFYGTLGTLNLADLALRVSATAPEDLGLVRVAGLLLFGVFALKAALVPLHLWLPTAYASTAAPVAALFAIMTKVGAYCVLRVETLIFGPDAGLLAGLYTAWLFPLALITLGTAALGVFAARELRRQIAYLVVLSVGLLFLAFGIGTTDGIGAGLYYLAHTTFAAAAFFLLADTIANGRGPVGDRLELGPVLPRAGWLGTLFFVTALLVVGLPPLSGFVGKLLVLRAALADPGWAWALALVLGTGLLAMTALARSGSLLFLRPEGVASQTPVPWGALLPVLALLGLCVALTLWAGVLLEFSTLTAEQLLRPQDYIQAVLGNR